MILARTHQLTDAIFLFKEKQMFAFNVLEECLQIDRGKTLLQKYHDSIDAQSLWIKFNDI
jgi:hypothetical protein